MAKTTRPSTYQFDFCIYIPILKRVSSARKNCSSAFESLT